MKGQKLRNQNFPVTNLTLVFFEGGLQPRNLRCLFSGGDRLTCSWEVKKVITTSILFGLFFKATPASEYVLCPWQCVCASPIQFLPVPFPGFPLSFLSHSPDSSSFFPSEKRSALLCMRRLCPTPHMWSRAVRSLLAILAARASTMYLSGPRQRTS